MNRNELIQRYREGYRAIVEALEAVDLDARPAPSEWTPQEIVHHLADAELTRAVRLRRLLCEESPHVEGFDQDEYSRRLHYDRPMESSLAAFKAAQDSSLEILERLTDDEWAREGTHSEFGRYGIGVWLERAAEHAHEHAEQIRRCKR
jgi:DinB family protein